MKVNYFSLIKKYGLTLKCDSLDPDEGDHTPVWACFPLDGGYWSNHFRTPEAAIKNCCKKNRLKIGTQ